MGSSGPWGMCVAKASGTALGAHAYDRTVTYVPGVNGDPCFRTVSRYRLTPRWSKTLRRLKGEGVGRYHLCPTRSCCRGDSPPSAWSFSGLCSLLILGDQGRSNPTSPLPQHGRHKDPPRSGSALSISACLERLMSVYSNGLPPGARGALISAAAARRAARLRGHATTLASAEAAAHPIQPMSISGFVQ